jgi:mannose-6-phosphate isomerase-like protein (cupin superfamily)
VLSAALGAGARLVRVRPAQAVGGAGDELYVVIEGEGWIRVGGESFALPRLSAVAVSADEDRELFNEGEEETLWLIVCTSPATTKPTG